MVSVGALFAKVTFKLCENALRVLLLFAFAVMVFAPGESVSFEKTNVPSFLTSTVSTGLLLIYKMTCSFACAVPLRVILALLVAVRVVVKIGGIT